MARWDEVIGWVDDAGNPTENPNLAPSAPPVAPVDTTGAGYTNPVDTAFDNAVKARLAAARSPQPTAEPVESAQAPTSPASPAAPSAPYPLRHLQALVPEPQDSGDAMAAIRSIGPDVSSTSFRPTAAGKALWKNIDATTAKQAALAEEAKGLAVDKAGTEANLAEQKQAELDAFRAQAEEKRAALKEKLTAADEYLTAKRASYEKASITDYWADKSDGSKAMAALLVGLGAFASSRTGGPNSALSIINAAVERDFRLKKEALMKSKDMVDLARQDRQAAMENINLGEVEIRNQHVSLLEQLADKRAAALTKLGIPEARIRGDEVVLGLQQQANQLKLQNDKSLYSQVTSSNARANDMRMAAAMAMGGRSIDKAPTDQGVTDGMRNNDKYLGEAVNEISNLTSLPGYSSKDFKTIRNWRRAVAEETKNTKPEQVLSAIAAMSGDVISNLSTPEARARFASELAWTEDILRSRSGGAITAPEYLDEIGKIQATDKETPQTLGQRRDRMFSRMSGLAGTTYRPTHWMNTLSRTYQDAGGAPPPLTSLSVATLNREQDALRGRNDPASVARFEKIDEILRNNR